mmetsp:Transcript_88363/g.234671  ORF Transcript_88363/g.234671 Transcript_88363/m.234671 type:complete len:373 (-) Transcript_88363:372-1490(-)
MPRRGEEQQLRNLPRDPALDHLLHAADGHDPRGPVEDHDLPLRAHGPADPPRPGGGGDALALRVLVRLQQRHDRLQPARPDDQRPLHGEDLGDAALLRLPVHPEHLVGDGLAVFRGEDTHARQGRPGLRGVRRGGLLHPARRPAHRRPRLQRTGPLAEQAEPGGRPRQRPSRGLRHRYGQERARRDIQDLLRRLVQPGGPHHAQGRCGRLGGGQPHGGGGRAGHGVPHGPLQASRARSEGAAARAQPQPRGPRRARIQVPRRVPGDRHCGHRPRRRQVLPPGAAAERGAGELAGQHGRHPEDRAQGWHGRVQHVHHRDHDRLHVSRRPRHLGDIQLCTQRREAGRCPRPGPRAAQETAGLQGLDSQVASDSP